MSITADSDFDWTTRPKDPCDIVMKGGITSGVVYPLAISELAKHYRLRGVGGSSAGAIGAALGAASEYGRAIPGAGFTHLNSLPTELDLSTLFTPQPATSPLFDLLMIATGQSTTSSPAPKTKSAAALVKRIISSLNANFPSAGVKGSLTAAIFFVVGVLSLIALAVAVNPWHIVTGIALGVLLLLWIAVTLLLLALGWATAMVITLVHELTETLPANNFGICQGLSDAKDGTGLTEWLGHHIDVCAGITDPTKPLTFGMLQSGPEGEADWTPINLQMVSTCLSWARPIQMPFDAHYYFYDPVEWKSLFPERILTAMATAPKDYYPKTKSERAKWDADDTLAKNHTPSLLRLPAAQHLPVIVATRLSLSFPLLISAVPMWSPKRPQPEGEDTFDRLWFTDGGLCNNFPVQMFDGALAAAPTYAINLGKFANGTGPDADPEKNIQYLRKNVALLPNHREIPVSGFGAVKGFALAAVETARNSQDNLQLETPGYRERVVMIKQSSKEGGLNLSMEKETVELLAERGRYAAQAIYNQFDDKKRFKKNNSGWDNHRWVRYRSLMASLPAFLQSFKHGYEALNIPQGSYPSYDTSATLREVTDQVAQHLISAAALVESPEVRSKLESEPNPLAPIRRVPQI